MSTIHFAQTLLSLDRDSGIGRSVAVTALLAVIGAATAWFLLARISVYEASATGRLEVHGASHEIAALSAGRIDEVRVRPGDTVEKGQVLLTLEYEHLKLELSVINAERGGLNERIETLEELLNLTNGAVELEEAEGRLRERGSVASSRAQKERARYSEDESTRLEGLAKIGAIAEHEAERTRNIAKRARADANAARMQASVEAATRQRREWERRIEGQAVVAEIAALRAEVAKLEAQAQLVEHEIAERVVKAPVSGVVGSIRDDCIHGAVASPGVSLLAVVPFAELHAVATFDAVGAAGRVRTGQRAWVRLSAYPSLQYGSLPARVSRVSAEPVDRALRVEFDVEVDATGTLQPEHGLAAQVEVEVERISPAELLLRAAGTWLSEKR